MALLQLNRRLWRNCLMATVVLLSIFSFLAFTIYTTTGNNEPEKLDRKRDTMEDKVTQLNLQLRKSIQKVEEDIKVTHQRLRSGIPKHNFSETHEWNVLAPFGQKEENYLNKEWVKVKPNYDVHIFYYPWYKNEKVDGKYSHWNHELIPHWSDKTRTRKRHHVPPDDIGANFYPKLGPYSSADPAIIDAHMKQIRLSGAGVLAVSWYPPQHEQTSETPVDNLMPALFDAAAKYDLKIAFHIEPYKNRSGQTLKEVVEYVYQKYGNHTAFYRAESHGRKLPIFYVYDSYQIQPELWADALVKGGKHCLRDMKLDAIFLGLLVEQAHFEHLSASGFDGFYTYFASNGFVYGSSWKNWPEISVEAKRRNMIFVPSIGPGYLDTQVRTWNGRNTKLRLNGRYYKSAFRAALAVRPPYLTVTSFNEWHEGTQVESAVPKTIKGYKYEDYKPNAPEFYLNLTRGFVEEYQNMTQPMKIHEHAEP